MKSNVGTANIVISSNDGTTAQIVLNDGNAVTYDSSTSILSAVDDNPTDVIMIIDGQESFIAPGSTDIVNIPPIVEQIVSTLEPTQIGTMISASANFIDQGITDTHVATWDWGDGTASSGIVSETNGSGSVTGEHQYTTSGTFTITLTVTDNDEESGNSDFRYVVIYNPEGGFVTGGGWIDSPVGADIANPDETGKANFGFVSKYKKGASEPTGQTEFYFDAGNLNFHSTSYEWLVVANAKAQYKGDGTINGQGSYKFMLTAIDSDVNQNDSHDTDKFRIIIWDDTGLRYDNQVNETDENADPTTVIGGGNIKIHKEK